MNIYVFNVHQKLKRMMAKYKVFLSEETVDNIITQLSIRHIEMKEYAKDIGKAIRELRLQCLNQVAT